MSLIGIPGQINLSSDLGKEIYNLVFQKDFDNIVDIGTWNGLGTTYCILHALENKKEKAKNTKLYTVELYNEMFEIAKINLKKYLNNSNFTMLNGKLINYEDAFWFDHSTISDSDPHAALWYKKDMELLKSSQNVLSVLPEKIDLLVLDGGEYTTYPEWKLLKNRTKFFILDDTNILKCAKIRQEILSDSKCTVLKDVTNDRNGYLIGYFND